MAIDFGHFALIGAWLLAAYGLVVGIIGATRAGTMSVASAAAFSRSAMNSVSLTAVFSLAALLALAMAFINHDYHNLYVWQHSNNDMAAGYLVSAVWGGMDGSMLLWAAIMSFYAAFVMRANELIPERLLAWLIPSLSGATFFFLTVVVLLTNPFRVVPNGIVPSDGNGLNPLLQNPSMIIHPPSLYLGFTGLTVPFAFAWAALLSGDLSDSWILLARRWTLVAWTFLTAGIILGGNWAYIELGWGGFWAWDPVENASFLPWLTATAFLHSVMVQEHRGMLKTWNVFLAILSYGLAVFGTFLTRSGVVQSVHAFAEADVGWVFLLYLGIVAGVTLTLLLLRRAKLRADNRLESYFSREAIFLFNNLILLALTFSILWGVMFPVLSEAFTGKKSVVGPPFFNAVNVPLFIILLFLMGIGPLVAWRKASGRAMFRALGGPFAIGSLLTVLLLFLDSERPRTALAIGTCLFVASGILAEFRRAKRARRHLVAIEGDLRTASRAGFISLVKHRPRRFGGLMIHLGVVVMAVAITASSAYKTERDVVMRAGESTEIGRFKLTLQSLNESVQRNYSALHAVIAVSDKATGEVLATLQPERRFYSRNQETTTEVDMRITPREDLYVALSGIDAPNEEPINLSTAPAVFKIFVNPLQMWLWVGGMMVIFSSLLVIVPAFAQDAAPLGFRTPREALLPHSGRVAKS